MCCAFHLICWLVGLFIWSFISCCIYRLFLRSGYDKFPDAVILVLCAHVISLFSVLLSPLILFLYPIYRLSSVVDKYEISFKRKD